MSNQNAEERKQTDILRPIRKVIGISIILMAIVYLILIVAGRLPQLQRIDAISLITVVAALLLGLLFIAPEALARIKILQIQGFKLEMLEKIKEKQAEQDDKLDDIALVLPLLLSKAERKHLVNLSEGKTKDYQGSHAVRSELRRLRSVRLIRSLPDRHISELKDDSPEKFDIANILQLTNLGKRWVKKIKDIEEAEKEDK
jgi:hypothetical protein